MTLDEITYTRARLQKAETIADSLRHDGRLHELALEAVFAIEDQLFALQEAAGSTGDVRILSAEIIPFPSRAMREMSRAS